MKQIFKSFAVFTLLAVLFVGGASKAQAQNANAAVGKATAAISDCLQDARQAGLEVSSYAFEKVAPCLIPPCPVAGYSVSFYGAPKCSPGQICPLYVVLIAVVEVDANGDVISVDGCPF